MKVTRKHLQQAVEISREIEALERAGDEFVEDHFHANGVSVPITPAMYSAAKNAQLSEAHQRLKALGFELLPPEVQS
jgi:hypothetical protein